jgi:GNAT superfamily N-acetyltransferase
MMKKKYFRKAAVGDEDALATLCGELGYPSSAKEIVERLSRFLDREEHLVLVAADDMDTPIGWIHACIVHRVESDAFVEIGGMVVSENQRGSGIGKQLLGKAEAWARSQKVKMIRVRSNVIREHAHDFYKHAGYSQSKTSHVFQKLL